MSAACRFRRTLSIYTATFVILLLGSQARGQESSTPADAPTTQPASLAGAGDEGTFYIYINEERLITMDFTWKPDGSYKGHTTISMAGQTNEVDLEIACDADGRWERISETAAAGAATLERNGGVVRRTIGGDTATIDLKPDAILFENYSPALMRMAVDHYDQKAGGKQTLPLLIIPGAMMDATLERLDKVQRAIGARDIEFTRYQYGLPGVDVTVWIDPDGRVCFADIPAQHAMYIREGYESLRSATTDDANVSKPEYEVLIDQNVSIPMRDGVELATDIYRPDADGQFPVILVRTPYQKTMGELQGRYYARRGYVLAIQDCRGRFASGGTWEPFVNEAKDGYDTVEWLAKQPWSTGKVGMIGGSYVGWVQWWAASENPPHLTTIIPNVSPPDPFYNIPYEYGVFFLTGAIWWSGVLESEATADLSGVAMNKVNQKEYSKLLQSLPVIDLDEKVLGKKNAYWRKWIEHPTNDAYWAPANFLDKLKDTDIPVFHQSGWFDGDGIGSKLNYAKMRQFGHENQKLVLGPWSHSDKAHRIPDHDFGPAAIIDLQEQYLRWFDYWLKGVDNGVLNEPLVNIFVMEQNEWLHGDVYPLPQTQFQKWYFAGNGNANTSKGDGVLTTTTPAADAAADHYTYDPGDPTPTPEFQAKSDDDKGETKSVEAEKAKAKAHHADVTDSRKDILVYTTEPLTEPVTIAGPVSATLYAASSAKDTDWFVRLVDVDEDGNTFQLVEGKLRARFYKSMSKPDFLDPGEVYEFHIDMWQTGIRFAAGHRIRVEVASASFPLFSRNLNTGGHNEMETNYVSAEQTIYHDAKHPSHVLLPVIPTSSETAAPME